MVMVQYFIMEVLVIDETNYGTGGKGKSDGDWNHDGNGENGKSSAVKVILHKKT